MAVLLHADLAVFGQVVDAVSLAADGDEDLFSLAPGSQGGPGDEKTRGLKYEKKIDISFFYHKSVPKICTKG